MVSALLSRSQVYVLKSLSFEKLEELAEIALSRYNEEEQTHFILKEKEALIQYSGVMLENHQFYRLVSQSIQKCKRKEITNEDVLSVFIRNDGTFMIKMENNIMILFRRLSNLCVLTQMERCINLLE